jgi:hypothetical protein
MEAGMSSLPEGWRYTLHDDVFKTLVVIAPNGWSAVTTNTSPNPENILRMLILDLIKENEK